MIRAKLVLIDDLGQSVESEVELVGSLERSNIDELESLVSEAKTLLLPSIEQKLLEQNQEISLKKKE